MMNSPKTRKLFQKACQVMPGGVNSSVRVNQALGFPLLAARASGSRVWDVDDREFIDMCCGHGSALMGHAHPALKRALRDASRLGFAHTFETQYHEELARSICRCVPCADRVRFCSSGSEATLHLIRVCRAYTGRKKIIRVEGHFHGYHELIYIGGQPPADVWPANRRKPFIESPGIPEEFARLIIPVPYNDPDALRRAIERHGDETACVILEPVNYNSGGIVGDLSYLKLVRKLTRQAGIVLFFDEIQSCFKKSLGGAQQDFGVTPDVCTIGKAIGGGLPLSAFCGKAAIMDMFKPVGQVQHSGTFNAHLVTVLAGLAFLGEATKPGFYPHLRSLEEHFHEGLDRIIRNHDLNMIAPHYGPRFNILLGRRIPARRYEETFAHDKQVMLEIIRGCWRRGVYFHDYGGGPSHHGYSIQHTRGDLDRVLNVLEEVLSGLKNRLQEAGS